MKKLGLLGLVLLCLPVALPLYSPELALSMGNLGLVLWYTGLTISPVILLAIFGRFILKSWSKNTT